MPCNSMMSKAIRCCATVGVLPARRKPAREAPAVGCDLRVEEFVGVLVRIGRRRFGAAKVNPVLIPRDDSVDRWVPPGTQTIEAKFVHVVRERPRQVRREELGRDLADHGAQVTTPWRS